MESKIKGPVLTLITHINTFLSCHACACKNRLIIWSVNLEGAEKNNPDDVIVMSSGLSQIAFGDFKFIEDEYMST